MRDIDDVVTHHLTAANRGFVDRLRLVRPQQWSAATPCSEWTVRQLVSHMVQANLVYTWLLRGGGGGREAFLTIRHQDTLGDDALTAFDNATAQCLAEFREPDNLDRIVDYPFGPVPGRQLAGLLVTDTVVHTWDLARAAGLDDQLAPQLVTWVQDNVAWIFHGVADSPIAFPNTRQYFAAPPEDVPLTTSAQSSLLHLMGRRP